MSPDGFRMAMNMITINRTEHDGLAWKKKVAEALKAGHSVTLKNLLYDSDMEHCEAIKKKHGVKLSVHLDYTVCCFTNAEKKKRGRKHSKAR